MAKLTLTNITSGYATATTINANNDAVETALENTLSRDGTGPNDMDANLDMNGHRILNLPYAVAEQEPITLAQAGEIVGLEEPLTQELVVDVLYPDTTEETGASITVYNRQYPPGNIWRYKASLIFTDATDWSEAIQAAVDISASGGVSATVPTCSGFYRCNTAIDISSHAKICSSGAQATIRFYGCHGFVVATGAAFIYFENLELFSLSGAGSADPKTHIAINVDGASGNACNYITCRDLYLRGWSECVRWDFTWSSLVDNCTTVNCDTALHLVGQSVNNSVTDSRLVANTGTYCVRLSNSGGVKPEGLMISNSLLSSGTYGIYSADPVLALHVSNSVIDLIGDAAIDVTNCEGLVVSNTWLYAANYGVRFRDLGTPVNQSASFNGNRIEVTDSGGRSFMVGANNSGITLNGGALICGSAGASRNIYTEVNAGYVTASGVNLVNPSSNTSVFIGTVGFQHNGLSGNVTITYNDPDKYTATLTGCTTSPTGVVEYRVQGDIVILEIPTISGTSNTTAATLTGMPTDICPSEAQTVYLATTNNGTEALGKAVIGTDGVITLYNVLSATFTNSGTKAVSPATVSYMRA